MAHIQLTRGTVIVDDEDYEWLSKFEWSASGKAPLIYAMFRIGGRKYKATYMHRLIMGCPPDMMVDHINRNTLDNRRANLRICSRFQNQQNRVQAPGKHGYPGVRKCGKYFYAQCTTPGGKRMNGGRGYATAEEASARYRELTLEHFGEYAVGAVSSP